MTQVQLAVTGFKLNHFLDLKNLKEGIKKFIKLT